MDYRNTYNRYRRPPLSPPDWIFGVVWPFLYFLIFGSYGFVFLKWWRGEIAGILVIPFIINLIANGLFTYFQFKLKNNLLAVIDILIVLGTIILTIVLVWPHYQNIAYLQIPYLVWVAFATYLQIGVTILNRKEKRGE
ncbi:MAG: tryptophan-rich sensory protein [Candidatus Berkelbacteria bacterium]|nr:tryptophan-rich sensory protein [Candidatus Berkelbacteria bacterium]